MNEQELTDVAADILADYQARKPYVPREGSLEDAYRVQPHFQRLVRAAFGYADPVGYKIALTSVAMQTMVGVGEPLAGCIFGDRVVDDGAEVRLADHHHLGVEFEVAVRMGADLAAGSRPHTAATVAAAVSGYAPAYELVDDRHADYSQLNAFTIVAENCWNAGVVLGAFSDGPVDADAATVLLVDGQQAGAGRAGDALGHPLEVVAWLANQLNRDGRSLKAGELVMTGSSIRTTFPVGGESYQFTIAGLGSVSASFV
ncbi:MAG: fumarylacetoacetate hydrolase family protein [Pseudomonadota bacterium]